MALTVEVSNHFLYQCLKKLVDVSADSFKVMLMDDEFVFDPAAHGALADLGSPSGEIADGSGYTAGGEELSGGTLTEQDSPAKAFRTFSNLTWTADGGNIGPTGGAIVYDDSTDDDTIVGWIDFGTDHEIPDGSSFQLQAIQISLEPVPEE